ncbi:hypothetical protein BH23GEM9_BH23GEM9_28440 [soil metagenome]
MAEQRTFAGLAWSTKGKITRREQFLSEMDAVIPWTRLIALIEPHYPKPGNGRPPLGLEKMLRIYFLQQWFDLSDPAAEDAIYDSESMRRFVKAKAALKEIMKAPGRDAAVKEIEKFREEYGAKYPKALDALTRNQDELLAFYDFPADHWLHIRTSNPIESAFATVRLRQRVTKGAGSRQRGLTMAFKLLEMAELRWRKLNGAALLPLVRAGVPFKDGVQLERDDQTVVEKAAEVAA